MKRGFTLIETLVYLGLYAVISLGMLAAVYCIFESTARNETTAMVEEEGDYLTAKINAALSSAASIRSPVDSGDTLSVVDLEGSVSTIEDDSSGMCLQEGNTAFQTLNNTNVSVTDLVFVHARAVTGNVNMESVSASFTLYATTSDGHELSRDFSTSKYLHL